MNVRLLCCILSLCRLVVPIRGDSSAAKLGVEDMEAAVAAMEHDIRAERNRR